MRKIPRGTNGLAIKPVTTVSVPEAAPVEDNPKSPFINDDGSVNQAEVDAYLENDRYQQALAAKWLEDLKARTEQN